MERVGLHVMFYYYCACLHLGKTKENFSIVGEIYFINTGYFTSDNATHNTFSNFRKKLATEMKISSFFRKWLNTNSVSFSMFF
jgi:hypothetical protein